MNLTEMLAALVGCATGILVTMLLRFYTDDDQQTEAYREGYETAVREQRERNEARARKAAQTRRTKS